MPLNFTLMFCQFLPKYNSINIDTDIDIDIDIPGPIQVNKLCGINYDKKCNEATIWEVLGARYG